MAWGLGGGFEKWSAVALLNQPSVAVHYHPGYQVSSKKGFISVNKLITDSSHKEVTASSDFWISLPVLNTRIQQELIKHHKIRFLVETVATNQMQQKFSS